MSHPSKAEVAQQRSRLARMRRGPEWQSLILATDLPGGCLPVFGLRPMPSIVQLFERYEEEHYFECGWALIKQDGPPEGWLEIEFFSPVSSHFTLLFTPRDVAIMQALLVNGGRFLLAIDKDEYKKGVSIEIEDVAVEVPMVLAAYSQRGGRRS